MPTIANQFLAPRDCKTESDLLALSESVCEIGKYWMLVRHDGAIHLVQQNKGEPPVESVTIPRAVFQRFLAWFETEQCR